MQPALTVADVRVRQDAEGRFCLNDLHKAAGGEKRHQPSNWLALPHIAELVDEVNIPGRPGIFSKQGLGTFVCKELVYAYAMWISPAFHLKVIRAYDAMVSQPKAPTPDLPAKLFPPYFKVARLLGCDKNAAAISANQAVLAKTGENVLQLMGLTLLEAENQETRWYTPSQLGAERGMSGRKINLLLAEAGLQVRVDNQWQPSDAATGLHRIFDTSKKHGSGVPVSQLKWSFDVLPLLNFDGVSLEAA